MRTGVGGLRRRVVCTLAPVLFLASACSEPRDAHESQSALTVLEQFAFVPEGKSPLPAGVLSNPDQISISERLLVGMYEVTRGEFRSYLDAAKPALDPLLEQRVESWPAADDAL